MAAAVSVGPIYAEIAPRVTYSRWETVLDADDDSAYNVVVLGPTGEGKSRSSIISRMFNRRVCAAADDVDSVTRNMSFISIIDSIRNRNTPPTTECVPRPRTLRERSDAAAWAASRALAARVIVAVGAATSAP